MHQVGGRAEYLHVYSILLRLLEMTGNQYHATWYELPYATYDSFVAHLLTDLPGAKQLSKGLYTVPGPRDVVPGARDSRPRGEDEDETTSSTLPWLADVTPIVVGGVVYIGGHGNALPFQEGDVARRRTPCQPRETLPVGNAGRRLAFVSLGGEGPRSGSEPRFGLLQKLCAWLTKEEAID
ncbi:hypothetical protein PG991_003574 [Apiospora marii]|uniref:Uncharacterized protein n=1 Tax=Apiospora marii TaxID=335849 RepID=A0ABR1S588_9PEZI